MRRTLLSAALLLSWAAAAQAHGLLIPEDKSLPPLAMLNHKVTITIEDQVAATRVEQTFRNHTDRPLEATYVFPVPKGATVNKFTMWVDGKEMAGELVEAAKARQIYTSIVQRTRDPGLLEYVGHNLLQLKVFPIPARGDQKVALSFSAVAPKEGNLVEYVYPLKTDGKATRTLEDFGIKATIKSQHAVTNVYSPTHAITLKRLSDKEVEVNFDKNQGLLDRDFLMFYATGEKDVGLTAVTHRPVATSDGYFMMLVSPKVTLPKEYQIPRDMVLVLDTSGSMRGAKMEQARKALKYCLDNLGPKDRFGLMNFATTVTRYEDKLLAANNDEVAKAKKWVDDLEATGGTAINDALTSALDLRTKDEGRSFTIVFFTDGQPTIGESDPEKILKTVASRNTAETRIFTFGVGDDVNASMLDRLAEQTRALSTYVRPAEDIEVKVSGLYSKISNPVLTNLKLATTNDVKLKEIYPPQLPDLFHGTQLVVFGRYSGKGPAAIRLTGQVGKETKEFVYELNFPEKAPGDHDFVEHLWARRKVGYMLDQIRTNGEKKELVDEVVALAKRYGITTPYTSYLIVPDVALPVAPGPVAAGRPGGFGGMNGGSFGGGGFGGVPPALAPPPAPGGGPAGKPTPVLDFARKAGEKPGELAEERNRLADKDLKGDGKGTGASGGTDKGGDDVVKGAREKKESLDRAMHAFRRGARDEFQAGKLGVDLAVEMEKLRSQSRLDLSAMRNVGGRNCIELGGVWIDEGFDAKMKAVVVKAQSDAYFRIFELKPEMKDVFRLGNHIIWVTPSGTALVIDTSEGKEKLTDAEIEKLFVPAKK
jgi:Ca-activated chloride channel family protein